jgi:hypothetical protein
LLKPDEGEDFDGESESAPPPRPLCSAEVASRTIALMGGGDEGLSWSEYPGPLLLAAGHQRGAVSKDLLLRNARRLYRYLSPAVPKVDIDAGSADDADPVEDDPPCSRPRDLGEAVCRLPVNVTELSYDGCRLQIDDKAKVVRVEALKAK